MSSSADILPSVVLRKLEPDDLPLLYLWENDSSSWQDGDTHNPLSHADLRDYIMSTTGDIFRDGQLRLMITTGTQNDPVGCVDLYDVDIRNRKAAVAIYIAPEHRRRGIAWNALMQLKTYAANILCFRMLYAYVRENNQVSVFLFQSAEYQNVACLPNWVNEGNIFVLQTIL